MHPFKVFLVKFALTGVLTLAIKGGVAAFDHWIAWWAAGLIASVLVFGGFLFLTGDDWWD